MKIVADENIEHQIVARLRQDGHDVLYLVEEIDLHGDPDLNVLALARQSDATLLTNDTDFGALIYRDGETPPSGGIVLLRLPGDTPADARAQTVATLFDPRLAVGFAGLFIVVSDVVDHALSFKSRPLPPQTTP